ncbi:hypothetical protein [Paraburkholderia sp. BCC1886]|uniref:hypothetical protein n=1 Tax=Paraburkholderia sp. BCC1886 TaxID=2562670 RepID=UPI0011845AD3|nr:hypothetical protein [Paraburkholderia sp. BCC1886]
MELQIGKLGLIDTSRSEVTLSHRGETIDWNISDFKTIIKELEYNIFEQINQYWATLPMEKQDQIFATYREIKDVFGEFFESEELKLRLYKLVAQLYEHNSLSDIKHWMDFRSNIYYPSDLKEHFVQYDMPGTREGTYLREDYSWLVAISISLRVILPVWGEFIARTREESGTIWKEYYAFQLLSRTDLANSEHMDRLRAYVESMIPSDNKLIDVANSAHVFKGISVEDYPYLVVGLVLVRKLSIGDVRGTDPNSHLVSRIFNFIKYKTRGNSDSGFSGIVKKKEVEGRNQDNAENQQSKLESCKVKLPVSEGKIAPISFYARDMRRIALAIAPDMPLEYLDMSFESVRSLENEMTYKEQKLLAMFALKPRNQLQPRGQLHLVRLSSLQAIAAAQAIYWHKGYPELAALVSAVARKNEDVMHLTASDSKARIPAPMLDELAKWYPHPRRQSGKQKSPRLPTSAEVAIDSLTKGLSEHDWRLTLPSEWVGQVTQNPRDRHYAVPPNIKIKLAQLSLALAQRSF